MNEASLAARAESVGILPGYTDIGGTWRETSDVTRHALLAALGRVDDRVRIESRVAPARVCIAGDARIDPSLDAVEIELEDGRTIGRDESHTIPLGYHRLHAMLDGERVEQRLIVVPPRCPSPAELLRGQRVFGLTANLYTLRSRRNWGVGDLTDLGALLEFAASVGAAFVGVNPLHALRNADGDISPYSPVSRLYRNPIYLDVDAVPELALDADSRRIVDEERASLESLRDARHVDYAAVMTRKRRALDALHRAHRTHATDARVAAFAEWRAREGEALERFARFQALDEHLRPLGAGWWREWPAELQDARSAAVDAFAREHAGVVDFHAWVQFELDRQLGDAARRGRACGMPLGLYQDLAIGTSPSGSDVWAAPELFVQGVSVGAPPDPLGPEGQNWGLPPIDPNALRADGYRYWSALLRGAMRHSGALRLDHVLGLFRQFWIPDGMSGADGAYVRFPTEDLLGILALEATRAGALVVGEDLGTVPPEVPPTLARWGVLSSKVLYFEREHDGAFRSPRAYPRDALATANTHDLAPLAGWWAARDVTLRHEAGLLRNDAERDEAMRGRARDREALLALLVAEGVLDADAVRDGTIGALDVRAAVHAVLRRSPSWLVGLALEDLVGEEEPVNVPGVGPETLPTWTRRLTMPLEQLAHDASVRRALGAERVWVP